MEMYQCAMGSGNLFDRIDKSLEEIKFWTWSELLVALKQCQELLPGSRSLAVLAKCMDCLILKVASSWEMSPCPSTSSPDSSGHRFSCDTRSTDGLKNNVSRESWWFEDLVSLDASLIKLLVKSMISRNFDNGIISKFLFYYQKSRFTSATVDDKARTMETIVEIIDSLDIRLVSYRSLFGMLQVSVGLNLSQFCRNKLESLIGSQLDKATLDNLLFPSPKRRNYLYDVNLVLRLLKHFIGEGDCSVPLTRLNKVAKLMDTYLAEVAPDPNLKPSKFLALVMAIPDSARDSCDEVYYAMNLYLEVHRDLPDEQRINLCLGLSYNKMSSDAIAHLSQNTKFPSNSVVRALASQQLKLKSLLQDTGQYASTDATSTSLESSVKGRQDSLSQPIVLYSKKLDYYDENEKMKSHLQGMQWRVVQLEKDCRIMKDQMSKMVKSRLSTNNCKAKYVPFFCS